MKEDFKTIEGAYVSIEELPIGCVITDKVKGESVVVGSLNDADLIIKSLIAMKEVWNGTESL